MDRQQILDLYDWEQGICFRHPAKGEVLTVHVTTLHPTPGGEHEVRGCEDCVITMEDIRREDALRRGRHYTPGQVGQCPG